MGTGYGSQVGFKSSSGKSQGVSNLQHPLRLCVKIISRNENTGTRKRYLLFTQNSVSYCMKITWLNLFSNQSSNQKYKTDSIFHHQLLTYYHDIKMAEILIHENPQITLLPCRTILKFIIICSRLFSAWASITWVI